MTTTAHQLAQLPFLAEVPLDELKAATRFWRTRQLAPGETLCEEDEPANELSLVLSGALFAELGGQEVGQVGAGELVGEVASFLAGARCSATVTATEPCSLLSLRRASLLALRRRESPVYAALLDAALRTLSERVRATDDMIAELCCGLSGGEEPPLPPLDPATPPAEAPPLTPMLRALPALSAVSDEELVAMAGIFRARPFAPGDAIVQEGLPGDQAFILASGQVEVRRTLADGRSSRLTVLRPGDLVGFNALVDGGPRSASCLALEPGWLHEVRAADLARLPPRALLAWREAALATLATQLRVANAIVSGARTLGLARALVRVQDFHALLAASGALVAHSPLSDDDDGLLPAVSRDPLSLPPKA